MQSPRAAPGPLRQGALGKGVRSPSPDSAVLGPEGGGGAERAQCSWPLHLPPPDPSTRRLPGRGLLARSVPPVRLHAPAVSFTARARPVRSQLTSLPTRPTSSSLSFHGGCHQPFSPLDAVGRKPDASPVCLPYANPTSSLLATPLQCLHLDPRGRPSPPREHQSPLGKAWCRFFLTLPVIGGRGVMTHAIGFLFL